MKKSLFILMAIAMVFVGCKKTEENKSNNSSAEKIEISRHDIVLTLTSDPVLLEEVSGLKVNWSSTDPEVATVRSGLVSPAGLGRCYIIAELNGATDTCVVSVKENMALMEQFNPHDWGLFGNFEPIEGQDTVQVPTTSGDTFTCVMKQITMYMWDDSIEYVSGTGMVGSGLMILADVRAYVIVEGKYKDHYIGSSKGFTIAPKDSMHNCSVIEGKISDNYAELAVDYWNKAWNVSEEDYDSLAAAAARDAYDASVSGAFMLRYSEGFYYPYLSILTSGRFDNLPIDETNPDLGEFFAYDINLDWFDFDDFGQFGVRGEFVEAVEDGDTIYDFKFDEPLQLSMTSQNYSNYVFPSDDEGDEEDEAPKYKIINPARIHEGVDPIKNWKRVDLKTLRTK